MSQEEQSKAAVLAYVSAFNRGDPGLKALLVDDAEIQGVCGVGTFERIEPIWRQVIEGWECGLKSRS